LKSSCNSQHTKVIVDCNTYCSLDSSSCSQFTILTMLGYPMELNIKCLLCHFGSDELGWEVGDEFFGQASEDVEGRYIQDFCLTDM